MVAINNNGSKLKVRSVEMPNAPYSNRYGALKKRQQNDTI